MSAPPREARASSSHTMAIKASAYAGSSALKPTSSATDCGTITSTYDSVASTAKASGSLSGNT